MEIELMIFERWRICPGCESRGVDYVEIPASSRTHERADETYIQHFGPSRDYRCRNCDTEFTLTSWED